MLVLYSLLYNLSNALCPRRAEGHTLPRAYLYLVSVLWLIGEHARLNYDTNTNPLQSNVTWLELLNYQMS